MNNTTTKPMEKNSNHLDLVIQDLQQREQRGLSKYQRTMDRTDLTHEEWLQHAYEEALDMALYLKKALLMTEKKNEKPFIPFIHRK